MASVMVIPTDYDSNRPRRESRSRKAWVPACGVGADQCLPAPPQVSGELGQGEPSGGDVIARGVGACVAGPQQRGHRLSGTCLAVVDERDERMMAEGLLPGRGRVLLLGVRKDQHAVDVDDHVTIGGRTARPGQLPDPRPYFGPRRPDRGERLRSGCGEGVDETGDRGIGCPRAEHVGLGPQHGDIGEAVPAQSDPERGIQQDLARVVHCPRLAPRGQCHRYRVVQAGLANRLHTQHRPGLRDHPTATALDADTRVQPDTLTHLESASFRAANRTLDKSHRCRSGALSAYLSKSWTGTLMNARG
ncbi:hypothetical protein GCM10011583_71370 [Streptomyces camponoticapitis]|uniref:Uncharacterized protein n=1 Tax=Streptomyces camponoticapitis TaxID=1616125 RepID=A0ABQ2EX51_9ACTN|nr:hypothetical protein GCM10011583_71370 [Streptomyces camponoticapitis]